MMEQATWQTVGFCPKIIAIMKRGGFYDRVMSSGQDLDRVKEFLLIMAGEAPASAREGQDPGCLPPFPGIGGSALLTNRHRETARYVEASFEAIREETAALAAADFLAYPGSIVSGGQWTLLPFYFMGAKLPFASACPRTAAVIADLPRAAHDYAWADALLSAHAPGTHLTPHASVDNLRVRCHLGIEVPKECGLRVGGDVLEWQEGKCLFFQDSFEHETWNRSSRRRVVLVVDVWHPDLTDVEIRVLTAGFRRGEIRGLLTRYRIGGNEQLAPLLDEDFRRGDQDPLVREWWS
jgi:aspartate beta-hydroxylase